MSQDRRDILQARLDQNYQDYIAQLQKLPFLEVIRLAPEITATQQICDELAAVCDEGDIESLLALDNPLELLRDNWKCEIGNYDHGEEMGHMLWYLFKREELSVLPQHTGKKHQNKHISAKKARGER